MTQWMVLASVALAGGLLGVLLTVSLLRRSSQSRSGNRDMVAVDFHHVLDLVRRVHGAQVACVITDDDLPTMAASHPRPAQDVVDRAVATARQAMGDGQDHMLQNAPEIVAVGDGRMGAALVLASGQRSPGLRERVTEDLRRLVAGARVGRDSAQRLPVDPQRALDGALTRLESVEGLATALCEAARTVSGLPTAIALRDPVTHAAAIVAVSRVSDHRLIGCRVTSASAGGRAIMGAVPVTGGSLAELLGVLPGDRRRRDEPGIAFPLHDGREGVGALIVFGQPETIDPAVRDRVAILGREMAPHLSSAAAVRAAETRSLTDELTGLPNARVLERTMSQIGDRPGSLLVAQVDHFKKLSDGSGHAAGDAALKHIGIAMSRTLRDGDLAARIGNEEFALWLVGATIKPALEVADRVRRSMAADVLKWAGADVKLTCSFGVACYPVPVAVLGELRAVASAAARRARDAGGDRVEVASRPVSAG